MRLGLDGRVAVVTGAGSGLGLAIAAAFEEEGAIVVRLGREPRGDRPGWRTVDVRRSDEVDAALEGVVAEHGRLDVMVNNAGLSSGDASSVEVALAEWHEILDTNLNDTWYGCRAAIRHMLAQGTGGALVNMSSRLALTAGGPGRAAYTASKAAISHLTRQLAVEYGPRGIRVNAICPGFVPGTDGRTARDPAKLERARRETPAPRLGTPADVAAAALYLASDAAGFVNGHNLVVDGGASVTP